MAGRPPISSFFADNPHTEWRNREAFILHFLRSQKSHALKENAEKFLSRYRSFLQAIAADDTYSSDERAEAWELQSTDVSHGSGTCIEYQTYGLFLIQFFFGGIGRSDP